MQVNLFPSILRDLILSVICFCVTLKLMRSKAKMMEPWNPASYIQSHCMAFRLIIEYVGNAEDFRDREHTSTNCAGRAAVNQISPI